MKKRLKAFYSFVKDLEINKNTLDVEEDLKYANLRLKMKYGVYSVVSFLAISVPVGAMYYETIKDPFRADLVKKANVAPAFSYFHDDYNATKASTLKELEDIETRLRAIQSSVKSASGVEIAYTYNNFVDDLKKNNISIENFDQKIKEKPVYRQWMHDYFIAYLVQKAQETVTINDKEYTLESISQKVKGMAEAEAKEHLGMPANLIIAKSKSDNDEITKAALVDALYDLSVTSLDNRSLEFLKKVELDDTNLKAVNVIKEALLNKEPQAKMLAGTLMKPFKVGTLEDEFKAESVNQKIKADERMRDYLANKTKVETELKQIIERGKALRELVTLIDKMRSDVAHYFDYQEKIDAKAKELKVEVKG